MNRTLKLTLTAVAAIAIGLPMSAAAQRSFSSVDPSLAQRGKTLWINRGCSGCHAIGRKMAGPDLWGVVDRRSNEWLRGWLHNTNQYLQTDPQAMAMLEEWHYIKMPQIRLSDAEIDALFHYIAQVTDQHPRD